MLSIYKIVNLTKTAIVLLLVCFLFSSNIFSATPVTWYVNDASTTGDIYCSAVGSGATTSATGSLTTSGKGTNPFLTLSAAIAVASSGDTIYVDAGTYADKNITLTTGSLTITGAGEGKTVFSSNLSKPFMLINANNVVLNNFSIYGYSAASSNQGEAITINAANGTTPYTVTLNAIYISNCAAAALGYVSGGYAAILINQYATVNITQGGTVCSANVAGNTASGSQQPAEATGGVDINGTHITVNISNYVFYNNYKSESNNSVTADQYGSAIAIFNADATTTCNVSCTNFDQNAVNTGSTDYGGALYINSGNLNLTNCIFQNNDAYDNSSSNYGGAIAIAGSSTVTITGCQFTGNNFVGTGGSYYGGAIWVDGAATTLTISSCIFSGNLAQCTFCSSTKGGVDIDISSAVNGNNVSISNSTFVKQTSYNGNVNFAGATGNVTITNCGTSGTNYVATGNITKVNGAQSPAPTVPSCVLSHSACSASPTTVIVLPISLTQFQGQCINNQVTLVWQTATETNNRIFNVEKSLDGIHYQVIGNVNGAGNSTHHINYTFTDKTTEDRNAYYRLSQEDYNGNSSKSKIIFVERSCNTKIVSDISIFPNPSASQVTLNLTLFQSSEVIIEIYNDIGQLVQLLSSQVFEAGAQTISIDNTNLSKGVYFIKVLVNKQESMHKLIKL